jgi:hypothetical protein
MNYNRNLLLCCITFGLWSLLGFILLLRASKKEENINTIDEDGKL